MIERTLADLPEDPHSERILLATCCAQESHAREVFPTLEPADFQVPNHRRVFAAAKALLDRGTEISPASLRDEIKSQFPAEAMGFLELTELLSAEEVSRPEVLAEILRSKRLRRQLISTSQWLMDKAFDPASKPEEFAPKAQGAIENALCRGANGPRIAGAGLVAMETLAEGQGFSEAPSGAAFNPTGIHWADEQINAGPGTVTIIGARMGVGKTTLAVQVAWNAALAGKTVLFASLEMGKRDLTGKLLSHAMGLDWGYIRRYGVPDASRSEVPVDTLNRTSILEGWAGYHWSDVEAALYRQKPDVLVVDYFEYLKPLNLDAKRADVGWSNLSLAITGTTKKAGIATFLLAQLHRIEEGHEPHEANLSQTDQLAKDASNIIFLWRNRQQEIQLKVAKSRYGIRLGKPVDFDGSRNRISGIERYTEPIPQVSWADR